MIILHVINPDKGKLFEYDRLKALNYAHKWALEPNPAYYDFSKIGGDCTNFISQVLFAGTGYMNYTVDTGWYYIDVNNRAPAWTGVNFLYSFLINNRSVGPLGVEVNIRDIELGDIIQLSFNSPHEFNHSLIVVNTGVYPDFNNIQIATHSDNRDYYPLLNYNWKYIRFLHIKGFKKP